MDSDKSPPAKIQYSSNIKNMESDKAKHPINEKQEKNYREQTNSDDDNTDETDDI